MDFADLPVAFLWPAWLGCTVQSSALRALPACLFLVRDFQKRRVLFSCRIGEVGTVPGVCVAFGLPLLARLGFPVPARPRGVSFRARCVVFEDPRSSQAACVLAVEPVGRLPTRATRSVEQSPGTRPPTHKTEPTCFCGEQQRRRTVAIWPQPPLPCGAAARFQAFALHLACHCSHVLDFRCLRARAESLFARGVSFLRTLGPRRPPAC